MRSISSSFAEKYEGDGEAAPTPQYRRFVYESLGLSPRLSLYLDIKPSGSVELGPFWFGTENEYIESWVDILNPPTPIPLCD